MIYLSYISYDFSPTKSENNRAEQILTGSGGGIEGE
jgi:hypothetical protein